MGIDDDPWDEFWTWNSNIKVNVEDYDYDRLRAGFEGAKKLVELRKNETLGIYEPCPEFYEAIQLLKQFIGEK